jgi:hypothetical protein
MRRDREMMKLVDATDKIGSLDICITGLLAMCCFKITHIWERQ